MKSQATSGRAQQPLSSNRFFAKYADLVEGLFGLPDRNNLGLLKKLAGGGPPGPLRTSKGRFMIAVDQLEEAGFSRILEAAEQENSPEIFKETLEILLLLMHVKIPEGVFTPTRKTPGRRTEKHSLMILAQWERLGRPATTNDVCAEIAESVFPRLANGRKKSKEFQRHIALVRSAIKRAEQRSAS